MFTYVLEPQNFVITKFFVAGCDDFVAWLEAFDDLVELWVLTTDTNLAFYSTIALLVQDINPLAACGLEECATRDKQGLF